MRLLQVLFFVIAGIITRTNAQVTTSGADQFTSAVPFLTINPAAGPAGMGETGVATLPDIYSQHWNPAKFAFYGSKTGIGISFPFSGLLNPGWLNRIGPKFKLVYLTGFQKINESHAISASFRYFSLGDTVYRNEFGEAVAKRSPEEIAFDFGYSFKINEFLSGAFSVRYIKSELSGVKMVKLVPSVAGRAVGTDLSVYYYRESKARQLNDIYTAGIVIQNLGSKISYNHGKVRDFLPATLKLGGGYTKTYSEVSYLLITAEASKLLVPSPVAGNFIGDSTGVYGATGLTSGKSVIGGIFSSFFDAPGGIAEELQEIAFSVGAEYKFLEWLRLRSGFFYESKTKGNRRYFTLGSGFKYKNLELDLSWLVPAQKNHPLEGTKKLSISLLL